MNIREIIQELNKTNDEIYSLIGKVTKVDKDKNTCTVEPIDGTPKIFDVKFSPSDSIDFLIVPKVDSMVVVSFMNKDNAFVSMFSEVDKYTIKSSEEDLKTILSDLIDTINQMTVTTAMGASGTPINIADFTDIKTRLDKLFN